MIELGICTGADNAAILADAGANFIELGVYGSLLPDKDAETWAPQRDKLKSLAVPVRTFNVFLSGIKLTGEPDQVTDTETVRRYVFTALRHAAEVDGKVIVFGSGGARSVPEGFPRAKAVEQIRDFLRICAEASEETGIVVAIEPLNQKECNIINTVAEAVTEYAAVLNHPGVRVLADTYHMECENEPVSVIAEYTSYIAHVHTADTGRVRPGLGKYDHAALFRVLHESGYGGRLSVEAGFQDIAAEAASCLQHLRAAEVTSRQ